MDKLNYREFLKNIEILKGLSPEELDTLWPHLVEKKYAGGELLFSENSPKKGLLLIQEGEVDLFKKTPFGSEIRLTFFSKYDSLNENAIIDESPHSTNARIKSDAIFLNLSKKDFERLVQDHPGIGMRLFSNITKIISRRMSQSNTRSLSASAQYVSGRTRREHDLLGNREVPQEFYYGIQTMRGLENFNISGVPLHFYPDIIEGLAIVKMAAAKANNDLGLLPASLTNAIVKACDEIKNGKYHPQFVIDMIQGGAGTSTNMNANEVIANRALEILGREKGQYEHCHPNNHVNLSQSTNDAYPTAVKIALYKSNRKIIIVLEALIKSFRNKAEQFAHVIKMGRTQLQDAVPMTLGQEFEAYATTLEEEIQRLDQNAKLFLEVNMGATAIGTGINSEPGYSEKCVAHLQRITGYDIVLAKNLIEATQDTGAFIMYSSAIKRLAVKLSKISNDLRLLSSGPRTGINEINLPAMQPGSSIMPGKVNPVIPEVMNQIAFKVIGNDLTVTLASEAGQLELNVMEPVIVQSIFESVEMLKNGMHTLKHRCIDGITANEERCLFLVQNSIGLVTALNPILGYETCTRLAKEALDGDRSVYDLVLEQSLLSRDELDQVLAPTNMIQPHKMKR
jgi:aspartate ammonia-lyase